MVNVLWNKISSNSIIRSTLSIGLITVLAKILGYAEKIVLAYKLGTDYKTDIYTFVLSVVMSVYIFFREVIEPGFLYVFLKALKNDDEKGAWGFFNRFGFLIITITAVLSAIIFIYAENIINVLAPGFYGVKHYTAVKLLKYAFPATILLSLSALTNITLNGQNRFVLPALGDLAFKLVVLIAVVTLFKYIGIYSLVYGLLLGSFSKLLIHSLVIYKNYSFRNINDNKTNYNDAWNLTWPLLIGVFFSQISTIVDNIFASLMKEGVIAALSYSKKIIELPILLFPYILSIVIFPYFSQLSIAKEKDKLSELLVCTLAWVIVVFVPISVFFNMFSYEIVEIVFQRGAFTSYSTQLTAYPVSIYSYGLLFFALETIIVIFFFANGNTKAPVLIGIICVCENIVLTYLLIYVMDYAGIAMALVISKATKVCILIYQLNHMKMVDFHKLKVFFIKIIGATSILPLFFYSYNMLFRLSITASILEKVLNVIFAFLIGTAIYILCLLLIRINKRLLLNF